MRKSQKTLIIVSILAVISLTAIFIIYNRNFKDTDNNIQNPTTDNTIEQDNFKLETEYLGDSKWKYTITGTLPNPCYTYDIESLVMESSPEQVNISIDITENDGICAQVIQEVNEVETFQASKDAQIKLIINK